MIASTHPQHARPSPLLIQMDSRQPQEEAGGQSVQAPEGKASGGRAGRTLRLRQQCRGSSGP